MKLAGRTLYKDGEWNTICLPFNASVGTGSTLEGAIAQTLSSASIVGNHVTLEFGDAVSQLAAGTPYIIKWTGGEDIQNPVFPYVTINAAEPQPVTFDSDRVQFIGYYNAFGITAADEDIYYLTPGNNLVHTGIDRTLNACRAYFRFNGTSGAPVFTLNFGDETTTIGSLSADQGDEGDWYTLQGLKVGDKKPTAKGIYIHNGKKVIVK